MLAFLVLSEPCGAQNQGENGANQDIAVSDQPDFNRQIYYKNKLELAFDTGWLWYNTPLILEPIIGEKFSREPGLPNYSLMPLNLSLRWHLYDICGPSILRGNTDFTADVVMVDGRPCAKVGRALQPNPRLELVV